MIDEFGRVSELFGFDLRRHWLLLHDADYVTDALHLRQHIVAVVVENDSLEQATVKEVQLIVIRNGNLVGFESVLSLAKIDNYGLDTFGVVWSKVLHRGS